MKKILPHLEVLDDAPLVLGESGGSRSVFEDDWRLIEELMEEGSVVPAEDVEEAASTGERVQNENSHFSLVLYI